jgi:hypothetical protein
MVRMKALTDFQDAYILLSRKKNTAIYTESKLQY